VTSHKVLITENMVIAVTTELL